MSKEGHVSRDPDAKGVSWRYLIDAFSGDGKRRQIHKRGFKTKAEAVAALDEMKASLKIGHGAAPSRMLVADYLQDRWLPGLEANGKLKPTTIANHRNATRHIIAAIGAVRLDALEPAQFDAIAAGLKERGKSVSLRRQVHNTARKAFGDAINPYRLMTYNPVLDATSPPSVKAKPKAWSAAEVERFLAVAAADRWAALWRLAVTTGMRRGELLGLRWQNVDLDRGELLVMESLTVAGHKTHEGTPKNDRARRIRIGGETVRQLKAWKAQQNRERIVCGDLWPDTGRVFTWHDGADVHPNIITRTFKRLQAKADVTPLRGPHNLRHTAATVLLENGTNIKDVSTRLGHSSSRVTMDLYVEPSSERDAAAAETLEDLFGTA